MRRTKGAGSMNNCRTQFYRRDLGTKHNRGCCYVAKHWNLHKTCTAPAPDAALGSEYKVRTHAPHSHTTSHIPTTRVRALRGER